MTPISLGKRPSGQLSAPKSKIHHGANIKRLRSLFGLTQQELGIRMGERWSQKRVSKMESAANIMLKNRALVAQALGIDVALIQEFDQQAGRLALLQVMQIKQSNQDEPEDVASLFDKMLQLLQEASEQFQIEGRRFQLIADLLIKAREFNKSGIQSNKSAKKSVNWSDIPKEASDWEVQEPGVLVWSVCVN